MEALRPGMLKAQSQDVVFSGFYLRIRFYLLLSQASTYL